MINTYREKLILIAVTFLVLLPVDAKSEISILIDAGHGWGTTGENAKCEDGAECNYSRPNSDDWPEGKFTLPLSKGISRYINSYSKKNALNLEAGLTRVNGSNIGFKKRINIAHKRGANYIISIHFNANECDKIKGCKNKIHGVEAVFDGVRNENKQIKFCDNLSSAAFKLLNGYEHLKKRKKRDTKKYYSNKHKTNHSSFFTQIKRKKWKYGLPLSCFLEVEFLDNYYVREALLKKNVQNMEAELSDNFIREMSKAVGDYLIAHACYRRVKGERKLKHECEKKI